MKEARSMNVVLFYDTIYVLNKYVTNDNNIRVIDQLIF